MSGSVEQSWTIGHTNQVVEVSIHVLARQQESQQYKCSEYQMSFLHSHQASYSISQHIQHPSWYSRFVPLVSFRLGSHRLTLDRLECERTVS